MLRKINLGLLAFFLIGNILFIYATIPYYRRMMNCPQGTVSPMVHKHFGEYYLYTSFINFSKAGSWSIPSFYSSEPAPRTYNWFFYILLGKIATVLYLSPFAAYHISRFVLFEIFLSVLWWISRVFVGSKLAFWAASVGLLSSPPYDLFGLKLFGSSGFMNFPMPWTYYNPLFRVDMVPHHIASAICMLASIGMFTKYWNSKRVKLLYWSAMLAGISSVFHPSSGIILVIGLPVAVGIGTAFSLMRRNRVDWAKTLLMILPVVGAGVGLAIVKHETLRGFPWTEWATQDVVYFDTIEHFNRDFITGGGVILVIAVIVGVIQAIAKAGFSEIFLATWIVLPYTLVSFSSTLGIAKFRLAYILNYIPMGIVVIPVVWQIISKVHKRIIRYIVVLFVSLCFLVINLPSIAEGYKQMNVAAQEETGSSVYIPKDSIDALEHLGKYDKNESVVLSSDQVGLIIPAYIPMIAYNGLDNFNFDYQNKEAAVINFFSGSMGPEQAFSFLHNGRVQYIFYGPKESVYGGNIEDYELPMEAVYKNATVTIYKVL